MGITDGDLFFKYTDDADSGDPSASLGGTLSPNTITSGVDNNLFDDVTGDESSLGAQHYRAIGIHNTLGTHIWMNVLLWSTGYQRSGSNYDVIYFGKEKPAGAGGDPDGTIQIIGSETVEPSAISWTAEGTPSNSIYLDGKDYVGSIGPDDWAGIWVQRSIPAGAAAYSNRSCTLRVEGETSASPYIYKVGMEFKLSWERGKFNIEKIFEDKYIIGRC